MRAKWIGKWIAIERVVAIDADINCAIRQRPRDAEQYVTVVELPIVECHLGLLVDPTFYQFGCACNAPAIFAPIGQRDTMCL